MPKLTQFFGPVSFNLQTKPKKKGETGYIEHKFRLHDIPICIGEWKTQKESENQIIM